MGLYSITLDDIIMIGEAPRCHVPNTPHSPAQQITEDQKETPQGTIPPPYHTYCSSAPACPMSFSSRRRNYLLTPHRRDGLIEWYVCMFVSRVVVNNVMM